MRASGLNGLPPANIDWRLPFWMLLALGMLAATFRIATPYSYWLDELYSVNASNLAPDALYRWILADVHPPLYQAVLWGWMHLFGAGEVATRSLSWAFAVCAAAAFFLYTRRHGPLFSLTGVAILATNPLFAYYANETRAYAMTLFLAVVVAGEFLLVQARAERLPLLLAACLLLALTHYFGLILAGLVLLACLFEYRRDVVRAGATVLVGLTCLAWPVHQVLNGGLLDKSGGNFWIEVNGIHDSWAIFGHGFLFIRHALPGVGLVICLVLACLYAGARYRAARAAAGPDGFAEIALRATALVLAFVLLVALVDLWSPMSTKRNYIVLLPLMAIIGAALACMLSGAFPRRAAAIRALVLIYCALALVPSFVGVARKSAPDNEDWQATTKALVERAAGRDIYFVTYRDGVVDHYLKQFAGSNIRFQRYVPGVTATTHPAALIYGRISDEDFASLSAAMKAAQATRILPVRDNIRPGHTPGIFLIP